MTRRLILSYLAVTLFTLVVLEVPLGRFISEFEVSRIQNSLERNATALATLYEDALDTGAVYTPAPAEEFSRDANVRVVVVDADGVSIVDTAEPANQDFSNRPEIQSALSGRQVADTRDSVTLGRELSYVAVPVASGGVVHGAVRLTFDPADIAARIRSSWWRLVAIGAVVLIAVTVVGWIIARSVTRPLRDLQEAAARAAAGDLSSRIDPSDAPPEVVDLANGFNHMASRLDELMTRQRRFVSDASHELRTPLTALRLRLENLVDASDDDHEISELEAALAETDRLSMLVGQLLTIARSEDGTIPLEQVDVAVAARDRAELWVAVAEEQGVELTIETDGGSAVVSAPPGAIDQIVDNLVSNALAATAAGGSVTVSVEGSDPVRLAISDTGRGMSDDERATAFDRFWRGDTASPGTGLGLAIVRELAEASGGGANIAQASGGGTTVIVDMPAR